MAPPTAAAETARTLAAAAAAFARAASAFRRAAAVPACVLGVLACAAGSGLAQGDIYQLSGSGPNQWFGYSVNGVGDLDLDGYEDFIIGAPGGGPSGGPAGTKLTGRATVYSGRTGLPLYSWTGKVGLTDGFGAAANTAGDTNQDGVPDVIVAAPLDPPNQGNGYFSLRSGFDGHQLYSFGPAGSSPTSLATAGDVDGDGHADFLVGWKLLSSGHVTVYSGKDGAVLYDLSNGTPIDEFGVSVTTTGDIDGDGRDDFAIGEPFLFSVRVYSGATGSSITSLVSPHPALGDEFGRSLSTAGDMNGDGFLDLIVGDPEVLLAGVGEVWVYSGKYGSILWHGSGPTPPDHFGASVAGGRDLNFDGIPDLLIGGLGTTAAWAISGANGSFLRVIPSVNPIPNAFQIAAFAGDVNGDGVSEAILGDGAAGAAMPHIGLVRVVSLLPPGIASFGASTPGCAGPQFIGAGGVPKVGNPNFTITTNHVPPVIPSLTVITDTAAPAGPDPYGIGIALYIDILGSSEGYALDLVSGTKGYGTASVPIPNVPGLAGRTFYAQTISAWATCMPTTFGLSASNALVITVQP